MIRAAAMFSDDHQQVAIWIPRRFVACARTWFRGFQAVIRHRSCTVARQAEDALDGDGWTRTSSTFNKGWPSRPLCRHRAYNEEPASHALCTARGVARGQVSQLARETAASLRHEEVLG